MGNEIIDKINTFFKDNVKNKESYRINEKSVKFFIFQNLKKFYTEKCNFEFGTDSIIFTVNGEKYSISYNKETASYSDKDSLICSDQAENIIFTISTNGVATSNSFPISKDTKIEQTYSDNYKQEEFKYIVASNGECVYKAVVKPGNAKLRDSVVFTVDRIVSKDNIKGDNLIKVKVTNGELVHPVDCIEQVFNALYEDYAKNKLETKKTNFADKIISSLKQLGLSKTNGNLLNYYINYNFKELCGNSNIAEDEIDISVEEDHMTINTIYGGRFILTVNKAEGSYEHLDAENIVCKDFKDETVFTISARDNMLSNTINIAGETRELGFTNTYDKAEFKYKVTKNGECVYKTIVKPVESKLGDNQVFIMDCIIPEKEKSESYLKRLFDNAKDDSLINVRLKNGEIVPPSMCAEDIYERLFEDCTKKRTDANIMKK